MHIAVNARWLVRNKLQGIGKFSYEVYRRIVNAHPEVQFSFLFDRAYEEEFLFGPNVHPHILHPQARHPILWWLWNEISVKHFLRQTKPDLYFSADGFIPLAPSCPTIAVLHDLSFEHYPEHLDITTRKYYKKYFPQFARNATRLCTVSEFSKSDLVNRYGVSPDDIDVVYSGCSSDFAADDETKQQRTREKFSGGAPYFMFVGLFHPRKNIPNMLRAYDCFRRNSESTVKFVFVGHKTDKYDKEIFRMYDAMKYKHDVVFTEYVTDEDVRALCAAALALLYVSIFEGFGVPPLEAMSCDCPVITSNVSSMPEICGDAAVFVDPFSVEDISRAMGAVASDRSLRERLIERGRVRKNKFSWDRTASLVWGSIETALQA